DAVEALLWRRDEWVMRDDHFENFRRKLSSAQLDVEQLFFGEFSVLPETFEGEGERPRGVDAHDHELRVLIQRAEVVRDEFLVALEREEESAHDVEEGDVVVAG